MKKYVISIIATLVVLFLLAQTGFLAPFGIKQISLFTRDKQKNTDSNINKKIPIQMVQTKFIQMFKKMLVISSRRKTIIFIFIKMVIGKSFL